MCTAKVFGTKNQVTSKQCQDRTVTSTFTQVLAWQIAAQHFAVMSGNGNDGDVKRDADKNTPGIPETSLSKALSEVVQDKKKDMDDRDFESDIEICQRAAAETELAAMVNLSNSSSLWLFNALEAFEPL